MKTLVLSLLLLGGIAHGEAKADPQADSEGFVPVQPGDKIGVGETIPGNRLVAAAYGFILFAIVGWTVSVAARSRRVEDELTALRKKIDK